MAEAARRKTRKTRRDMQLQGGCWPPGPPRRSTQRRDDKKEIVVVFLKKKVERKRIRSVWGPKRTVEEELDSGPLEDFSRLELDEECDMM